ncbi:hypothetical protein K438DRAFT_1811830, partial [Mycena galopus ATCC 62051]
MAQLPQELIDEIIELAPPQCLVACALTATSFVKTSQRRIFSWMSLVGMPAYERMAGVLHQSPHLGKHVYFLALDISGIPPDWNYLKLIVSTTTEVQRLTIKGHPMRSELAVNPSLIDLVSLPSLRCLGLSHLVNIPGSLITKVLESCEEVSLTSLQVVQGEDQTADSPPPESDFLWHLHVEDGFEELMPFLLHPRRLGYLRYLSRLSISLLPIPESLHGSFTAALAACTPTLERLDLEYTEAFPLPPLPALWRLELVIHGDTVLVPASIPAAISLALMSTPNLELLVVNIRERPAQHHLFDWGIMAQSHAAEWSALDAQLLEMHTRRVVVEESAEPSEGPEGNEPGENPQDDEPPSDDEEDYVPLAEVHFALWHFHPEPDRFAAFTADVKAKLPRSVGAGAEFVTFSSRNTFQHPMDRFSSGG